MLKGEEVGSSSGEETVIVAYEGHPVTLRCNGEGMSRDTIKYPSGIKYGRLCTAARTNQ